jgi:hypothetical protein
MGLVEMAIQLYGEIKLFALHRIFKLAAKQIPSMKKVGKADFWIQFVVHGSSSLSRIFVF